MTPTLRPRYVSCVFGAYGLAPESGVPAKELRPASHTGAGEVTLDSYIVSATPFEDLQPNYDDGTWSMERFAERHILFPVRTADYDYLAKLC